MDSFINKIFKNKVFNKDKMLNFGFKQKGGKFVYRIFLLDNQFELTVTVSGLKNIETKLTDCATGDLYTLHLVETAAGTFVGEVREAYENSLNLIAAHCCNETYFIYPQSNRIADLIKEKYSDIPEFLWEKVSDKKVGLRKEEFDNYFFGCKTAYAFELCNPIIYRYPISLSKINIVHPPQSFC